MLMVVDVKLIGRGLMLTRRMLRLNLCGDGLYMLRFSTQRNETMEAWLAVTVEYLCDVEEYPEMNFWLQSFESVIRLSCYINLQSLHIHPFQSRSNSMPNHFNSRTPNFYTKTVPNYP